MTGLAVGVALNAEGSGMDPATDSSTLHVPDPPDNSEIEPVLAGLFTRANRAFTELHKLADSTDDMAERRRLRAKAEGVDLVCQFIREAQTQ